MGIVKLKPDDFIETARDLCITATGKPKQVKLRRGISTAYYAMFHCLCRCCADCLIGTKSSTRSNGAWHQTYRALEHGHAKRVCGQTNNIELFPQSIQDFAITFTSMQLKRHDADYNPAKTYYKSEVLTDVESASTAIDGFSSAPLKDRRAFAAYVLLKMRKY